MKPEKEVKFGNPASGGTAEWSMENEKKDLIYKASIVDEGNYLEILNIKDGIEINEQPKTKWDLKTTFKNGIVTLSKLDPNDKVAKKDDKGNIIGEGPVEVQLASYNLKNKADVMSFLRNEHKYSTGTYKELSELADAISKAAKQ
jgi:hypothetical protein